MRIRVIHLQNPPKDTRFFTENVDKHAIKTALKVSCIFKISCKARATQMKSI